MFLVSSKLFTHEQPCKHIPFNIKHSSLSQSPQLKTKNHNYQFKPHTIYTKCTYQLSTSSIPVTEEYAVLSAACTCAQTSP